MSWVYSLCQYHNVTNLKSFPSIADDHSNIIFTCLALCVCPWLLTVNTVIDEHVI